MGRQGFISYVCTDCAFVFRIYRGSIGHGKRLFCPKCGENHSIEHYVKPKQRQYNSWTDDELLLIDKVRTGELYHYQAAILLDRTVKSIRQRVYKRIKELNEVHPIRNE